MSVLSWTAARSFYDFLRATTQEAVEQVTDPGDDFERFGIRSRDKVSLTSLQPGNLHLMLASAELEHPRFTAVVLGCGRGGLLLPAARYAWRRLVGVEPRAELCWEAEHNLQVVLRRTGWRLEAEVVHAPRGVAGHELPAGPFALVLERCSDEELPTLIERLEGSLRADPRECAVFVSPLIADELARSPLLRAWREGDGWRCLVGRSEQPRQALSRSRDPQHAPRWELLEGRDALESLAPEWDELAHRDPRGAVASSLWASSWCDAFLREGERFELHALRRPADGRLLAVLPLRSDPGLVSARRSLLNDHHPYWSFAVDESSPGAMRSLLVHLLATRDDADLIELRRLHRNGFACERLIDAAEELGLRYQVVPDGGDTFLRLAPWPELERRFPANVRKHVPRKLRRLRDRGRVELEVVRGGATLARELDACFQLEAKGWKGVSGSPIRARPETLRFYTALAERSAAVGRFALYLLKLDGEVIAFEYCLRGSGRIDLLKLSYDPAHAALSPGLILRVLLLEHEARLGEIASYHMGLPGGWKLEWASGVHPLCTLRVYAPSLKALAAGAGPALSSSVRLALKARPRLLSAVRWGRTRAEELRTRWAEVSG